VNMKQKTDHDPHLQELVNDIARVIAKHVPSHVSLYNRLAAADEVIEILGDHFEALDRLGKAA
jgi:hypothetical protein